MTAFPLDLLPSQVVLDSITATRETVSHNLHSNVRSSGAQLWKVKMSWPTGTASGATLAAAHAFLVGLKHTGGTCTVVVPDKATPNGTWTGTPLVRCAHTLSTRKVISASLVSPGTGGTPGAATVTGTTGTGTKFTCAVTIGGGGAISDVGAIITGGAYTVDPSAPSVEPVTGGGLTGAELSVVMESWGGATILIDGLTYPQTAPIKAGDLIKFAGHTKVYMVIFDSAIDASGNATLLITPGLAESLINNEGITVTDVPVTCGPVGDLVSLNISGANIHGMDADLVERIA